MEQRNLAPCPPSGLGRIPEFDGATDASESIEESVDPINTLTGRPPPARSPPSTNDDPTSGL